MSGYSLTISRILPGRDLWPNLCIESSWLLWYQFLTDKKEYLKLLVFTTFLSLKDKQDNSYVTHQGLNDKAYGKVLHCQILRLSSEFPLQIHTWFFN